MSLKEGTFTDVWIIFWVLLLASLKLGLAGNKKKNKNKNYNPCFHFDDNNAIL